MWRILIIIPFFFSCNKNKADEPFVPTACDPDTISYSQEIVPQIIDQSCNTTGCHDATGKGGWTLTTHAEVIVNTDILFRTMAHEDGYSPMPRNQPQLADSLIQKFYCWIQQGRLNN